MATTAVTRRRTPGVYIEELDAFPPSIIGVPTAIPAFIGYTEKAEIGKKPILNKPVKIGSMVDFEAIFGKNYDGVYDLTEVDVDTAQKNGQYDFSVTSWTFVPASVGPPPIPAHWTKDLAPKYFSLTQSTPAFAFNLYNSMRLFYANGGGTCYVVSVGLYEKVDENGIKTTNPIDKDELLAGLAAIKEQAGPTMLVVPDAVLLPPTDKTKDALLSKDFTDVVTEMLKQCHALQDRVAILDVYATALIGTTQKVKNTDDIVTLADVIAAFRSEVNAKPDVHLNYGMAYFPFPVTSVLSTADFDYTSLTPIVVADPTKPDLTKILTWRAVTLYGTEETYGSILEGRGATIKNEYIDKMETTAKSGDLLQIQALNQNLAAALPLLNDMFNVLVKKNDVLPPSAGIAGVITAVDNNQGVWNAPANVTMSAVTQTTLKLNNEQQGDLNVPIDGKAINALREFPDRGTVVWGARTLDGNSNDWRYIQVRRTLIYIEQSIKAALNKFVFAPNDANTWVKATAMVSAFLTQLWSQGGLMGAKASEAFTVQCGLGSTMTAQDILDGYMIVQITVQMIRPAEFIVLTFKQKMEGIS
ncbi:MAG TPA: phage tail sheath C-terminal domain-containing protein [Candidatus Angelobacter sp.]